MLNRYIFHISLYDPAFFGAIFVGLTFALLLWSTKSINRTANRLLSLALIVTVLWMIRILGTDIGLGTYLPHWHRIPLQFSLALGPLIYFYVLKATRREYKFRWRDMLHFCPVLLEAAGLKQLDPFLPPAIFISVLTYLYLSRRLIEQFYKGMKFNEDSDRYRRALRWLHRLVTIFCLLWLLWIPLAALDYLGYHHRLSLQAYYPLYILLAAMILWIGAAAFLRTAMAAPVEIVSIPKASTLLKQKGTWLKKAMEAGLYYRDAELSLSSLAENLNIHPHELSRIINIALKKNFNDFINEYRVKDVALKMHDPAYNHLTLLGIAYESGFNSKTTFSRAFRRLTGKTPGEYSADLKKEGSSYNSNPHSGSAAIILGHKIIPEWSCEKVNRTLMFKNYLKIAWRSLLRNKTHAFINISGLAAGMAVTILIGLWIFDELSYNKSFPNYTRIAAVMQHTTNNGEVNTQNAIPYVLGDQLRKDYGSDFKYVAMSSWNGNHILALGEKKIIKSGNYMEPPAMNMLSLKMLEGTYSALRDPHSIILSGSTAKALFGDGDPMNKIIKIDNKFDVTVTGVYEDLPYNSHFNNVTFIAPWKLYIDDDNWVEKFTNPWANNSFQCFVQVADAADMNSVSAHIKDVRLNHVSQRDLPDKPVVFLQPMSKWHLYSEFQNGVNTGGRIEFVWLFGTIGFFVLLLACINFMNLSTARSEKRAREVGIRKAIGSLRGQIIRQFFCESVLVALLAFVISLVLVVLVLPAFNDLAGKKMLLLWDNPLFWLLGISFSLITGLLAGSYPAFYLSAFQPVKVLKGTFRTGRSASLPRKFLVVLQMTTSVMLIIGTIVVFRQVQFAKNRPVGYNRDGLAVVPVATEDVHKSFAAIRDELISSGMVTNLAETSSATTGVDEVDGGFEWSGKDPALQANFGAVYISTDFGKTVGWHIKDGRDFSRDFNDSLSMVLNEAAVKFMGLKHPVGETIKWFGKPYLVIGVIDNMVMDSPYSPVLPTVFVDDGNAQPVVELRINPARSTHEALQTIASVFKKFNPMQPFSYTFADADYAQKFDDEERIGKLANCFTILAIFISCLGLYGMASFMAEQRTKEIGVRKVLGASITGVWGLLSKDFAIMVMIAVLIASPFSWYFMHNWLKHYIYRTDISWWIFAATAAGALLITLLTVSYQSLKAALVNPVKSLRSE